MKGAKSIEERGRERDKERERERERGREGGRERQRKGDLGGGGRERDSAYPYLDKLSNGDIEPVRTC